MTLRDLIEAVHRVTDDDRQAVAILRRLLSTGRVRWETAPIPRRTRH